MRSESDRSKMNMTSKNKALSGSAKKARRNARRSTAEMEALWVLVQRRELLTAEEVTLFYIPISTSALHHGECGTHVLTRVSLTGPGKQRGRSLFVRTEVEIFCKRVIGLAQSKNPFLLQEVHSLLKLQSLRRPRGGHVGIEKWKRVAAM